MQRVVEARTFALTPSNEDLDAFFQTNNGKMADFLVSHALELFPDVPWSRWPISMLFPDPRCLSSAPEGGGDAEGGGQEVVPPPHSLHPAVKKKGASAPKGTCIMYLRAKGGYKKLVHHL